MRGSRPGGDRAPSPARRQISRHLAIATAVLLALTSTAMPASAGPALLVVAIIVGLPHGGLDHVVARGAFAARFGKLWWLPFLGGYLALAAGVFLAWRYAPTATLAAFLLLSILHFGAEDSAAGGDASWAAVLAHGGVPVVVPAIVHPKVIGGLFSLLAGDGGERILRLVAGPIAAAWLIAASALVYRRVRSPDRRGDDLFELGGAVLLFAVARPLSAFAIYFAVVHTPRAFGSLRRSLPDRERHRLVVRSLPLAGLGILASAALFVLQPDAPAQNDIVRAVFFMLAALTVPHMWLAWLSDRALRYDRLPNI